MNSSNRKRSYSVTAQFKKPRLVAPAAASSSFVRQSKATGGWASYGRKPELKFVDTVNNTSPTAAVATFGTGVLLNGMATGATASDRIGRRVVIKSLLMRYQFAMTDTSTFGSPIRILIVYDKQANAAAPAITDILLTDHFSSQNNLSNRDRFVTICDVITTELGNQGQFNSAGVVYKKLNLETMFNGGSAGTIADITSGSLYMFVAQTGRIGVLGPSQATRIRVRYDDA